MRKKEEMNMEMEGMHTIRFSYPLDNLRLATLLMKVADIFPPEAVKFFEENPVLFTAETKKNRVDVIRLCPATFRYYN